ncbi:GTP-binding protein [Promethearchaeum syntrophicum]|uniref:GTP-binding protein n=1 Tax=Promethearchaeum syntrophicum TaxID=2594042 RepID=A0A5B9DG17_9ARCH|nr:GTP-binding protein [Candidatus Prometheoarchaeum syntrophicum]QEE18064.1 Ras family protein [Candidatus Prometheoarchaeum syntrophicum]
MANINEQLDILLDNYFVVTKEYIEAVYIFNRDGLLLQKKTPPEEERNIEEIYGAIAGIVETTLKRITKEYAGSYGIGTFDVEDYRLIFLEAGTEAILLSVFRYDVEMNNVLPYSFLIAEKISKILEGETQNISLNVPNLQLGPELSLSAKKIKDLKVNEDQIRNELKKKRNLRFKLIVLGDPSVGKTTLINRFVTNQFYSEYKPTLGISITNQEYYIQGFEDKILNFMIWDLAGQKFFQRVRKAYYRGANAAFIAYDITNRKTFESVSNWIKDIRAVLPDIPIILLGNKIDLNESRVVSTNEGSVLGSILRCSFLESSAKSGENVRDAFNMIGIELFFKQASK